jgi:hypothetical protein
MTTSSSSLAPAQLGSQVAWPLLGVLVPPLGLLIVLTIARSTLKLLNHGDVILAVITYDLRTRR